MKKTRNLADDIVFGGLVVFVEMWVFIQRAISIRLGLLVTQVTETMTGVRFTIVFRKGKYVPKCPIDR